VDGVVSDAPKRAAGAPLFDGVYAGRRVLVTGDTGFKGSWLCAWLSGLGATVGGYALAPPTDPSLFELLALRGEVAHVTADVRDLAALSAAVTSFAPELVFHLAAQPLVRPSYADPRGTFETNVMGVANLLEAVRACPSVHAVVNVTSDKCYENRETTQAYTEADALGGHDPYSASKGCAELVTGAYRRSFFGAYSPVCIASARAGNVIGGGDWAADRLVPDCVRAIVAGAGVVVRHPDAVRPWQHVLESLSGYLWLGARLLLDGHECDGAWNFGPGAGARVPVAEVVGAFLAAYGAGSWRAADAADGQPHEAGLLLLDCAKARDELGWRPVWDVRAAIVRTAAWYRAWAAGDGDLRGALEADIADYGDAARALGVSWTRGVTAPSRGAPS
jgi:CDP-glucose 4,6-dehydratase